MTVDLPDEPGAFGQTTRQIADAGVNVDLIYLAKRTRLVLGGADADQIRAALGTS